VKGRCRRAAPFLVIALENDPEDDQQEEEAAEADTDTHGHCSLSLRAVNDAEARSFQPGI
jgi:hypothetical protein